MHVKLQNILQTSHSSEMKLENALILSNSCCESPEATIKSFSRPYETSKQSNPVEIASKASSINVVFLNFRKAFELIREQQCFSRRKTL